ncbi:G/U mismatch-specific DNA glycosylase [Thermithiobacillus plumbiphilus]|uniref:G/U mismatch-specific DNA glycosylase n=1 Tax=Thermithiobacillus plumbiphilus TaxID=1729899 RepID=A0ABU9D4H1_9PROT
MSIPDLIAPDLDVLFCGINPGLHSAALGHHFARPGNRFWRALHESGFSPRQLTPAEKSRLLEYGLGITVLVQRPTRRAAELQIEELRRGLGELERRVSHWRPRYLAFLGVGAFRLVFACPGAQPGLQDFRLQQSRVWLLPEPSGLNAHYPPQRLAACFREFLEEVRRS